MPFDTTTLDQFPKNPGVYLMKDENNKILYIGKANNLRNRVKQYFKKSSDKRLMIPFLTAKVVAIDTIVVSSEKEALLLENNLIKTHTPPYNVIFKDDKSYIALKVTTKSAWPQVMVTRYRGAQKNDGLYFGPYTSAFSARTTLELIQKVFPLRQCSDQEFAKRERPCILYDMKRCLAPCVNLCTKETYDAHVLDVIKFLKGQNKELIQSLYKKMEKESQALEFEKAKETLSLIESIEKTLEKQLVEKPLGEDCDVLGLFREADLVTLSQLLIRDGKLTQTYHYNFTQIEPNDEEVYKAFLMQLYLKESPPQTILLPILLEDKEALEEILSSKEGRKITLTTPQKGDKKNLVLMALTNAEAQFKKEKDEASTRETHLLKLQELCHLSKYPKTIECFDNSNLQGSFAVGAKVCFVNGEKNTKGYRHYKIKTVTGPDDYGTFKEVLFRSLKRAQEEESLPDLVIVDGGKGQLNLALSVLKELNLDPIVDLISLAKEEGRHDKGLSLEQIFIPEVKDPILLKHSSPVLFLLQRIRDEAHRFALSYHKKVRLKTTLTSVFDTIPGIGPKKRKALLKHFGSVKRFLESEESELKNVKELTAKDRENLKKFKKENPS
jgi:excinuclease ABC subunit C